MNKKYLFKSLSIFYALIFSAYTNAQMVSTLAGSDMGFADGVGILAKFDGLNHMVTDSSGNIYVADANNHKIRKITPAGVVTTIAGSTDGFVNASGTLAKFSYPNGIAIDAAGDLYVADLGNNKIRKITSAGLVSTFAGSIQGDVNGTGTAARFWFPKAVAVDASGNVYVSDNMNDKIKKITSGGVVTTLAGTTFGYLDGPGNVAQFNSPEGLVVDSSGNIYVADYGNERIRKITPSGVVSTVAGSTSGYANGIGTAAMFDLPISLTIDNTGTNLYVADSGNNKIRKVSLSDGAVTNYAGSTIGYVDGIATSAKFDLPAGVTFDAVGNIYISDNGNNKIRKIAPATFGLEDIPQQLDVIVTPNPTSNIVNITLKNTSKATTKLYDVNGKFIQTDTIQDNHTTINVEKLPKGVYVLQITTDNGTANQKIIKE